MAKSSLRDDFYQRFRTLKGKTANVTPCFLVMILSMLSIGVPVDVEGSEFRMLPSISLSEEYNDNIFLARVNRVDDYITGITPSLHVLYKVPNWDWDVAYDYNYRYYAKATTGTDTNQTLNLAAKNRIVKEVLFLDVNDQYTRVSLDVARDYTQESNFVNQSDRNVLTVNPYVVLKLSSQMTATTGYVYMNTWYKDPTAIDRKDQIGYVEMKHDLSLRSSMSAGFRHTLSENSNQVYDYKQDDLYLGQHYEYADNSTITITIGNSWFDFIETARSTTQVFWDAIITQHYPTITVSYETGLRYIPDPLLGLRREDRYMATIRKDIERTSLVISGGLKEYREAKHKDIENTSYELNGSIRHAITTKTSIVFNLAIARLQDYLTDIYSSRYLTGVRLEHGVMESLTLALDYRYTNVYSPDDYLLNYENNRILVELRKVF